MGMVGDNNSMVKLKTKFEDQTFMKNNFVTIAFCQNMCYPKYLLFQFYSILRPVVKMLYWKHLDAESVSQ